MKNINSDTLCFYDYEATYSYERLLTLDLKPSPIINNSYKKSKQELSWLRRIKVIK